MDKVKSFQTARVNDNFYQTMYNFNIFTFKILVCVHEKRSGSATLSSHHPRPPPAYGQLLQIMLN